MHGCHWREFLGRWPSRSPGTWRLLLLLPRQTGGSRRGIHDTLKPKDLMNSTLDKKIQSKDVLLFRYEDPGRVFRRSAMAFGTFPVWTYLSYFSYNLKSELDGIREGFESSQAYRSRGWVLDNVQKASGSVAVAFFMFGCGLSSYWGLRSFNTVRRLVLRKGGKHVTVVTYGFLPSTSKQITIPVSHCSGIRQQLKGDQRFFLAVKDRWFKYQFNLEDGIFSNKPLFDRTVGISRRL